MASKKTLNEENLARLGADRLAALLLEVSTGDTAIKRRLRFELAGEAGAKEIAREIRKRLKTIAKARSFVDWSKTKVFVAELETQSRMILDKVVPEEPDEGFELLWQFVELAPSIYERCDDSSGNIGDVFYHACSQIGDVALKANIDPLVLAQRVFGAISDGNNDYGQFDGLIGYLGPALGDSGLEHLKSLTVEYGNQSLPETSNAKDNRMHLGGGRFGYSLDRDFLRKKRERFVRTILEQIADQQGDVDAFIAQQSGDTLTNPQTAADIAKRLLTVDRATEALKYLDAVETDLTRSWQFNDWNDVRIETLDALSQDEVAKDFIWECFKTTLRTDYLRNLMKRLADFDDFECERRAFEWVSAYPDVHQALGFFIQWPALEQGSKLVLERLEDIDGNHYQLLSPAANALQGSYPLASTLLRRKMIDFSLNEARSSRYKHAARHLLECQSARAVLNYYGGFVSHEDYVNNLKANHGRKTSFWSLLAV